MGISFENRRERAVESALESERELYADYMKTLGMKESDLKGKAIVDVGAGSRMFAAHLLREGISDDILSVEPNVEGAQPHEREKLAMTLTPALRERLDALTRKGMRESLPLDDESVDLVVNHGAMPGSEWYENQDFSEIRQEIEDSFDEIMRVLRRGGEARLMPLWKIQEGGWGSEWRQAILNKLDRMEKDGVSVQIEEADRWRNPGDKEETVSDRIILKKLDIRGE